MLIACVVENQTDWPRKPQRGDLTQQVTHGVRRHRSGSCDPHQFVRHGAPGFPAYCNDGGRKRLESTSDTRTTNSTRTLLVRSGRRPQKTHDPGDGVPLRTAAPSFLRETRPERPHVSRRISSEAVRWPPRNATSDRDCFEKASYLSQAPIDARRLFSASAGFGRRVRRIGLEQFFQRRLVSGQWTRRTLSFELLEPLDSPFTIEGTYRSTVASETPASRAADEADEYDWPQLISHNISIRNCTRGCGYSNRSRRNCCRSASENANRAIHPSLPLHFVRCSTTPTIRAPSKNTASSNTSLRATRRMLCNAEKQARIQRREIICAILSDHAPEIT